MPNELHCVFISPRTALRSLGRRIPRPFGYPLLLGVACFTFIAAPIVSLAEQPRLRATLKGHPDVIMALAFSPDGKTLASGSRDTIIKLWNVETGRNLFTREAEAEFITSLAFSPDGKTLASGAFSEPVQLWDAISGKRTAIVAVQASFLAFSPDGKFLAIAGRDGAVKLLKAPWGTNIKSLGSHDGLAVSVAFSPDEKRSPLAERIRW